MKIMVANTILHFMYSQFYLQFQHGSNHHYVKSCISLHVYITMYCVLFFPSFWSVKYFFFFFDLKIEKWSVKYWCREMLLFPHTQTQIECRNNNTLDVYSGLYNIHWTVKYWSVKCEPRIIQRKFVSTCYCLHF